MLATIAKTPELVLTEGEAKELAGAISQVNDLYDFSVISEHTMAWISLTMVAGTIYGPRFIAAGLRKKQEKQESATQSGSTVTVFPSGVALQ
jgi:hypothetical protein